MYKCINRKPFWSFVCLFINTNYKRISVQVSYYMICCVSSELHFTSTINCNWGDKQGEQVIKIQFYKGLNGTSLWGC